MKKNILFVIDERRMGGVSVLLNDMLNMLDISKYNIDILCLHNNGEMLENLPKGVNMLFGTPYFDAIDYTYKEVLKKHSISLLIKKMALVFDMKTGFIKYRIMKERKKVLKKRYDVEIAFKDGFTALFTIFGNSVKKIHWLHYEYAKTNPNAKYDKLFRKILPNFNQIIAVSDGVKNDFNSIYHLEDKVIVIQNLVDTHRIITMSKEKSEVKIDRNDFNVVSIGRLHQIKGFDRSINAIHRLHEQGLLPENFKYRIYGDGPERDKLQLLIDEYKLNSFIFFMGQVMNPYKHLKNNDLFVLPSYHEAFGLVIIESMTLMVPVLSTFNSATSQIIRHDQNGFVVDNSEDGIYGGLKYILTNKSKLSGYKRNLQNYEYDNNTIIKQIEEVLAE